MRFLRKYLTATAVILGGLVIGGEIQFLQAAKSAIHEIDLQSNPNPSTWQQFLQATPMLRRQLWQYHTRLGHKLSDWSWQWRLAWVRSCKADHLNFCKPLLESALRDQALVVRAEAASQIGQRYRGTNDASIAKLLQKAAENPRNDRRGRPLYVQNRILYALHEVGGLQAAPEQPFFNGRPELANYWQRIAGAKSQ